MSKARHQNIRKCTQVHNANMWESLNFNPYVFTLESTLLIILFYGFSKHRDIRWWRRTRRMALNFTRKNKDKSSRSICWLLTQSENHIMLEKHSEAHDGINGAREDEFSELPLWSGREIHCQPCGCTQFCHWSVLLYVSLQGLMPDGSLIIHCRVSSLLWAAFLALRKEVFTHLGRRVRHVSPTGKGRRRSPLFRHGMPVQIILCHPTPPSCP